MKKIWKWLNDSNRLKHFGLGFAYGLGADDTYCAVYGGIGVSGALEFKDCHYSNGAKPIKNWDFSSWDWIDFALTFAGVMTGYSIRLCFIRTLHIGC